MRQLCNLAWTMLSNELPPKERDKLSRELNAPIGKKVSHGATDLMAVMRQFGGQNGR